MAYSTVSKSTDFFQTKRYVGTGSELAVTGVGFQPGFTWFRNASATQHQQIYDAARGAGEVVYSNLTNAEGTVTEQLKSFDADGYTIGTDGSLNESGETFTSWNFKTGTTSGITGGTITPTAYSINTTSKFGCYTYAGTGANATLAHGLGAAPSLVMTKSLGDTSPWAVWCKGLTNTEYLVLNDSAAKGTSSSNMWNSTSPTDTLISFGSDGQTNGSGKPFICYAWADVPVYQLAANYMGNGQAIGSYIACGFKPTFVMTKRADSSENWTLQTSVGQDAVTNSNGRYNPTYDFYLPDTNTLPGAGGAPIDFYSTGFKLRTTSTYINADGGIYNFLAIGQPIVGSTNVITTAR